MSSLICISLNAQGLNVPEKRSSLLRLLWSKRASVAFLQETHFRADRVQLMTSHRFPDAYHSCSPDSKTKGVTILIARSAPWAYIDHVADPEGRFLFVKGKMADTVYTFCNLYLPNNSQPAALDRCLREADGFLEGVVVLGGDLNMALNPLLDTSAGSSPLSFAALRRVKQTLHSYQLTDTWRLTHPSDRDYTFYSHPHRQYSRIDYLLLSHSHLTLLTAASIDPISFSDHALISITLSLTPSQPRSSHWRLNEGLLRDMVVVDTLRSDLALFFSTNDSPEVSRPVLWETHKCFIRGSLIKLGSRLKRERAAKIVQLVDKIAQLDSLHKKSLAVSVGDELCALRRQLRDLTFVKAKASLARCRRVFYELGNKPGKVLARSLRLQRARSFIPQIHTSSGHIQTLNSDIAESFRSYYSSLYNLTPPSPRCPDYPLPVIQSPQSLLTQYIVDSGLPKIPHEALEALEEPFTSYELEWAIKTTQAGKAPGPDGFTLPYYKTFLPCLQEHLLAAFNSLATGSALPMDSLRAHISVIPKEGRDPASCQNYRPISLLNLDIKLFAKILANRLTPWLQRIIHPDQAGFMPSREARDNTTRAINLIHRANLAAEPLLLLSTDAEKAFDRVSWPFLMSTLQHIGLGPRMLQWIGALYSTPSASVLANGFRSSPFMISNGTRQGCPLSPLIFILTLEPLLRHIRASSAVQGVVVGGHTHKVAAYADDLLFFLTSPGTSLPPLLSELDRYSQLSNYKINLEKSEALAVSMPTGVIDSLSGSFPFKWASASLKYLGIHLTPSPSSLYRVNFLPLLAVIKGDLERWHKGTFTWLGRCSIFKMNILPRLLYLFQAVPIRIPQAYFRSLASIMTRFIWAHRSPRIARSLLYRQKSSGGLGLPNLYLYYVAAHLTRIIDWHRHTETKLWVPLEASFSRTPLVAASWLPYPKTPSPSHPTISTTLVVSSKWLAGGHLAPRPSPLLPVLGNPAFPPGFDDPVFRSWTAANTFRARAFLQAGAWLTHEELCSRTEPCSLGHWRALQLRHFLTTLPNPALFSRSLTDFESTCLTTGTLRHSLSLTYAMLGSPPGTPRPGYLDDWERDLGRSISDAQASKVMQLAHTSSISSRIQETGFKILARWYRVPTRLHRIFPSVSPLCWRECGGEGTIHHIFWGCPRLSAFWKEVWRITQTFTERALPFDPGLFLLHLSDIPIKDYRRSVVRHLVNAARACIPALWRRPEPPSLRMWLSKVDEIFLMEDLTSQLYGGQERFMATWFQWTQYQESVEYRSLVRPG